jgi:Uroporphyrinogen decarboxylase (URO-D)
MDMNSKIENNKAFVRQLWSLENERRPGFMIGYVGPKVKNGKPIPSALFSAKGPDTVRDRLLDPAKFLRAQIIEIDAQIALQGDFVPSLCPTLGLVGIPSAFGCEVIWWENDLPAVRSVVGDDPESVYDFPSPTIRDGELGRMLDYTRYFIEHSKERYPIRMSDIQGPLDSAALIMGHNNFLMAMYTHPDAVHHLLQKVTDLTIAFVLAQRELALSLGCEFVPSMFQPWMPDGLGVSISNDECVMISAAMHDEFSVPYLNQFSDAFGGVYLHSCGKWTHQFPSLAKIHHLRGHEFGASEATFEPVLEHFNGKIVLACRAGLHRDLRFAGMADYVRRVMNACQTYRGLFINVDITNGLIDDSWPETDLEQIYRLFEGG